MKRSKIADVLANPTIGETITVKGWVKANRANRFVQINDGSTIKNIQAVVDFENFDEALGRLRSVSQTREVHRSEGTVWRSHI